MRRPTGRCCARPTPTIERVTDDIARFHFNTAVSAFMELTNAMASYQEAHGATAVYSEAANILLLLLAPMTPHITEELWQQLGGAGQRPHAALAALR